MKNTVLIALMLWSLCYCSMEAAVPRDAPSGVLRVATCQFPVGADVRANAERIRAQMREARQQGADVVHFCESALPGYVGADHPTLKGFDWELLTKETKSILALAAELKLWVVLGSMHRLSGGNKPHNCLYLIGPDGKIVDRYDKRFCTGRDLRHYSAGDHFVTFEVNGVRCGLLICYDLGFPELYRQYAKRGVRVMFHSFYNACSKENAAWFSEYSLLLVRSRAFCNGMFVSMSNTSGPYNWPSCEIEPDGTIAGKLTVGKPDVMIIEMDTRKKYKDSTGAFRMRAIDGKLSSGPDVDDPRSRNRTGL
ncbi:MAG: carbon-nitrogen hydrolase family protein [Pseudomonadota bacterium]|nr:carbon-nitrogen hydrolase family protein [Pseudomonadota bacterium]